MNYKWVRAPENYPGKTYTCGNRILEHHLVWWRNTGQLVRKGYVVHHKNEDKADNRFENLELKKNGKHTRDHHLKAPPVSVKCGWCGRKLTRTARDIRTKNSLGQYRFFCNSSHAALAGHRDNSGPSSKGKTQPLHG